jgi:nucleoside phosphorylase
MLSSPIWADLGHNSLRVGVLLSGRRSRCRGAAPLSPRKALVMSLVCVFAASKMEGQPIQQIAGADTENQPTSHVEPLRFGPNEVILIIAGMGPKNARSKAREAFGLGSAQTGSSLPFGRRPNAVLVIGLCGGLTNSFTENKIVAYTDCLSTEPSKPPLQCSPTITKALVDLLLSRSIPCERAVGITSPLIAVTRDDKLTLAKAGANAVDMESYEILAVAAQAGVPAAVLRVVADTPDTKMPDFNRALNQDGGLDGRKALRIALTSPIKTASLLAANKRAMSHLTKALQIVLPADCFSTTQI